MDSENTIPVVDPSRRRRQRLWLIITAVLFVAWICWLGFLALTASRPVVLSRPQFLLADLQVIAEVKDLKEPVVVEEVLWPDALADRYPPGTPLTVANLTDCDGRGWEGPGRYIIPLMADDSSFRVAPIPPSPGFPDTRFRKTPPRLIYPTTPDTIAQARALPRRR